MEAIEPANGASMMPDEQAADLRRLQLAAAAPNVEMQQLADTEAAQVDAAALSLEQENEQALMLVGELASPVFAMCGFATVSKVLADPNEAMTDLTNAQVLAKAWAPVLTKYGVNLGDMGGRYKAEISALMLTLPIGKAIWEAVKKDTNSKPKPVPKAVANDPAPAPVQAEPERLG